ncbi:hypothetical protein NEOLEDRAFT_754776 [Neolentinus lepideus HHB14362 ss-1]|uniref:Ricin B lectin domain-containing protein n=1 Tax=Neolentinus lepideus HHB14362 ss-1 TaxID=1314782 RepID=A0A165PQG6_9AGAM|nr:hypothetical protein NEOLEDRAFT_754776 [Neolentinus lepideus HHB14362 ss-1]
MDPASGYTVDDGCYQIVNIATGDAAACSSAEDSSPLRMLIESSMTPVEDSSHDHAVGEIGMKWMIKGSGGDKYAIYTWIDKKRMLCTVQTGQKGVIITDHYQRNVYPRWKIRRAEPESSGTSEMSYWISPADQTRESNLFWSIDKKNENSLVTLSAENTDSSRWRLVKFPIYIITNVMYKSVAFLKNSDNTEPLSTSYDNRDDGAKVLVQKISL